MTTEPEQHDAFREQRASSLYWLKRATEEFEVLEMLEDILPQFVRWRYRIATISRRADSHIATGSLGLQPVSVVDDDVDAADRLHADVTKLFDFLLTKRVVADGAGDPERPTRRVVQYNGTILCEFRITGLPGFEGGLDVNIGGLPAGSACRIIKTVKGSRIVEEVEYQMVCDDAPAQLDAVPAQLEEAQA
ncbi:hypothetical protein LCGC14_1929660 [marine sediment metagenome]|uniref:Uncharacterized protein n=1 Tax=marine sediment metagenome TaxID=412755 RepID=A0A0F9IL51_9ZZZZ